MIYLHSGQPGRIASLLVDGSPLVEGMALELLIPRGVKTTYRLVAEAATFAFTSQDATTYGLDAGTGSFAFTGRDLTFTKLDVRATRTVTLTPASGWAYVDTVGVANVQQIAYQTTTSLGNSVTVSAGGVATVGGTGRGTYAYRTFNAGAWSAEQTAEPNPVVTISAVDTDDIFLVAQAGVSVAGSNLAVASAARIRSGNYILNMESYAAGASPTFTAPSLATVLSSGMPLGTVTLELMRAA